MSNERFFFLQSLNCQAHCLDSGVLRNNYLRTGKPFSLLDRLRFTKKTLSSIFFILQFNYLGQTQFFRNARIFQSMPINTSLYTLPHNFFRSSTCSMVKLLRICHHSIPFLTPRLDTISRLKFYFHSVRNYIQS